MGVLVQKFSTEALEGTWDISAGLNKAFDIFDCQKHVFTAPSPQKLVGNLQWRIKDPVAQTSFVTRYTVQEFEMDKTRQGILYNHDNDFLHYEDDWYVLAAKDQKYVVVYYRQLAAPGQPRRQGDCQGRRRHREGGRQGCVRDR